MTIQHGDLRDGDLNWREGILFRVSELTRYPADGEHVNDPAWDTIRFSGIIVDRTHALAGTGYDGGRYGAYAWVNASIEPRKEITTS